MRYLTLGKTGLKVSEVGFGGIPIIRLSMEDAVAVLRRAVDRGVTLFDTANLYMDSEEKFGRALAGERPRLVLATKSIKRDRAGVEAEINLSLDEDAHRLPGPLPVPPGLPGKRPRGALPAPTAPWKG